MTHYNNEYNTDRWGISEGHGTGEWLPKLKGTFVWTEDLTTDYDYRRWGETIVFHQHLDPKWFGNRWSRKRRTKCYPPGRE